MTELFMKILDKSVENAKIPKDFGTGETLYSTEIHTIHHIGEQDAINITQLSKVMGISKAAISKFVNKMVKKGYVSKICNQDNKREVKLFLTEKGRMAYEGHKVYHEKICDRIDGLFKSYNEEEVKIIKRFVKDFEKILD
jgi:DNA-binding MarR family transcriptional regulator